MIRGEDRGWFLVRRKGRSVVDEVEVDCTASGEKVGQEGESVLRRL